MAWRILKVYVRSYGIYATFALNHSYPWSNTFTYQIKYTTQFNSVPNDSRYEQIVKPNSKKINKIKELSHKEFSHLRKLTILFFFYYYYYLNKVLCISFFPRTRKGGRQYTDRVEEQVREQAIERKYSKYTR